MDIYEDDGSTAVVNLSKARDELKRSSGMHNVTERRAIVAEISAAALLDIARSLRPIGAEAASAMRYEEDTRLMSAMREHVEEPVTDANRDFLVVGDLVVIVGETEPLEVTALGFSEGELTATVVGANGDGGTYFASGLERIIGERPPAELEEKILSAISDEPAGWINPGEDPDNVDDLDEDFEPKNPEAGLGLVGTIGHEDALAALSAKPAKTKKKGK